MPWCPKCKMEYREGFTTCSECHVDHLAVGRAVKKVVYFSEHAGIMQKLYGVSGCETFVLQALYDSGKFPCPFIGGSAGGKMDFQHRRDAFCGKFSVTDVFTQYGVPFTVLKPHVVHPLSPKFQENLRDFAAICRVVNGMKRFNLGCIGARTTAFKTTRFDEIAMQKHGINVESFDLSELFFKVQNMADDDPKVLAKKEHLIYEDVIEEILRTTGMVESSLASKLIATVNDSCPIIDKYVLKNLGMSRQRLHHLRLKFCSSVCTRGNGIHANRHYNSVPLVHHGVYLARYSVNFVSRHRVVNTNVNRAYHYIVSVTVQNEVVHSQNALYCCRLLLYPLCELSRQT